MTKNDYLKKLRSCLAFAVSENELKDIVSDMEEVFADSLADGKSEEQICLALGLPKEAAANILLERGVNVSMGKLLAKTAVFLLITAISMCFLWNDTYNSVFLMPFIPIGLLLFAENGKLTELTEKKMSLSGIVSCILPVINVPLVSKLADSIILGDENALFPLGVGITAVTAASLVIAVLSVRTNPYGVIIPAAATAATICIAVLQAYAAFHISDTVYLDVGVDIITQQIAFRGKYLLIFLTTAFIAGIIIFVLSAFRRDKSSIACMYAVSGTMMLLSRERHILRTLDITANIKPILHYIPASLCIAVFGMLILSVTITICLAVRKAKCNG